MCLQLDCQQIIMSPLCSGSDYALVLMILGKVADAGSNRNGAASGRLKIICGGPRLEDC